MMTANEKKCRIFIIISVSYDSYAKLQRNNQKNKNIRHFFSFLIFKICTNTFDAVRIRACQVLPTTSDLSEGHRLA